MATEQNVSFVFHDPSGKRWSRFQRGVQSAIVIGGIGFSLFVLSMIVLPQLPSLGLPAVSPTPDKREVSGIITGKVAARNIPFKFQRDVRDMRKDAKNINYVKSNSPVLHPKVAPRTVEGKPVVFGFYVNWDPASQASLRANITRLTHLVPEWFYIKTPMATWKTRAIRPSLRSPIRRSYRYLPKSTTTAKAGSRKNCTRS